MFRANESSCYKCKKCRRNLIRSSSILSGACQEGKTKQFLSKNGKNRRPDPLAVCTSVYVEPVAWMSELIQGNNRGCLYCPKCSQKVGHFDWSGIQCSCGKWVSPAIQLQKKQMDAPILGL